MDKEEKLQFAYEMARATLPPTLIMKQKGQIDNLSIKFKFHDDELNLNEYIWGEYISHDEDSLTIIIGDENITTSKISPNSTYTFPKEDVVDFLFMKNKKMVGNFTFRVLCQYMDPNEAYPILSLLEPHPDFDQKIGLGLTEIINPEPQRRLFENKSTEELRKLKGYSIPIILLIVGIGFYSLIQIALCLIFFFGESKDPSSTLTGVLFLGLLTFSILTIVGLIFRSTWGRYFGILYSFLILFQIPIGTVIGIFSLIALFKGKSLFGPKRMRQIDIKSEYYYRISNHIS